MIKNWIQSLLSYFNYKIINLKNDKSILDNYFNKIIDIPNPLIFDVGSNVGQSIEEYKKLFSNPKFHCFEPDKNAFEILKQKYSNSKNIYLNSFGLGETSGKKTFNSYVVTAKSSFVKLNTNTEFIKYKSSVLGINPKNYLADTYDQVIETIDDYCNLNNIHHIDILKIDTQGYEDKVIEGAVNMINKGKIDLIKIEIIFSSVYNRENFNIHNLEKILIPAGYKIFGISTNGNLLTDQLWQSDFAYLSNKMFKKIQKDPIFKSFNKN